MKQLSYENQLLIHFARNEIDETGHVGIKKIIENSLNWDYIFIEALRHGIAPLLYYHIKESGYPVPSGIFKSLEKFYYKTVASNTLMFYETVKILKSFDDAGIKAIILKGPALANTIYNNPGLRPFSDIDLLIPRQNLNKATAVLKKSGYILPDNSLPIEAYTKFHFHISAIKRDTNRIHVELHWHLSDTLKYTRIETVTEKIWENVQHTKIRNLSALTMMPEDLLLYLCFHLDKHGYMNNFIYSQEYNPDLILNRLSRNRLIWFVDIHEVIKFYGEKINWKNFIEKAKKWDETGCITSCLYFTNWLFKTMPDPYILKTLNPAKTSALESLAYKFIIKRYNRKGESDYMMKFIDKNILGMNKMLQFRPIRLACLNHRIIARYILFPFEILYYLIKDFFSRRKNA